MLIAAAVVMFLAFFALAVVGVQDARSNVRRFERELDFQAAPGGAAHGIPSLGTPGLFFNDKLDALDEVRFTTSLAALSRVQQSAAHSSPEPVPAESSSLVSVPLAQSKTRHLVS